ncbi:DinB family protein [Chloroflexus sp.]|uniref:DinB family protein n=1 Tax=Chloroflexus sp. TaxID=1904827 RepID=UPI00298EE557|nr:DinB family protein [Chloroflexus sp.]MDW8403829.1 DinB family protein [Chloroflexus sp.]
MDTGVLASATAQATTALKELEQLLGVITDADLHRAEPNGGWTCAQVVSHIHLCSLLWIADLERLRLHPEPHMFMFREELGHDAVGAPPPSTAEAAARIASARVAIERSFPTVSPEVLAKTIEIPTLGTFTVAGFMPIISGHLAHHVEQIKAILRSRGVLAGEAA